MTTVKKGLFTKSGEWWRHLRWMKRSFWKGERQAGKIYGRAVAAEDAEKTDTEPDNQAGR